MKYLSLIGILILSLSAFASDDYKALSRAEHQSLWNDARANLFQMLEANVNQPDKRSPHRYTKPAPKFDAIYLWDSAFISQIWISKDISIAKDSIRSVLHNQQPSGRIPLSIDILGVNKSSQPPLLAWAAERILKADDDLEFAKEVAWKLYAFHRWYVTNRKTKNGLFAWDNPFESGMDNSPRFSNRDNSRNKNTQKIEAVDLSSYLIMDAEALIAIFKRLQDNGVYVGGDKNANLYIIDSLEKEKAEIADLINKRLWHPELKSYYDYNLLTKSHVETLSIAAFLPMTAGISNATQTKFLMDQIMDENKFNTPIPFPSVSADDKDFELDMWRGPIWVNSAYLVIEGMRRYGYREEAREMSYHLVDGIYKTWANSNEIYHEYYDPFQYSIKNLTRKKGLGLFGFFSGSNNVGEIFEHFFAKMIFLGNKPVPNFVGWTGLVATLEEEENLRAGDY